MNKIVHACIWHTRRQEKPELKLVISIYTTTTSITKKICISCQLKQKEKDAENGKAKGSSHEKQARAERFTFLPIP